MPTTIKTLTQTRRRDTVVISREKLRKMLLETKGATAITFIALTDARTKKTDKATGEVNPHYGDCYKVSVINAMVNFWYVNAVLNRLSKEDKSFDAYKPGTSWHVPLLHPDGKLTPFHVHKKHEGMAMAELTADALYAFVYVRKVLSRKFQTFAGKEIAPDAIKAFLPPKSEYKNQGTDEPVTVCTFCLKNILLVRIGGINYKIA